MSALKGGVPRGFKNQKGPDAYLYRSHVLGLLAHLPALPAAARPTLRECGLAAVDLARLRRELEELRARRGPGVRRGQEKRLRSEIRKTRVQLMLLERRLEEMAGRGRRGRAEVETPTDVDELLRQVGEAARSEAGSDGD